MEKDKKQHDSKLAEQEQRHQEKLNRIEEAHKLESHTWTLKLAGAQAELEMSQERITKLQAELQTTKLELQNSLSKYEAVFECNVCYERPKRWKVTSCGHLYCERMRKLTRQGKTVRILQDSSEWILLLLPRHVGRVQNPSLALMNRPLDYLP